MDFAYSERCERLRQQLLAFMEAHVYPNERRYKDEVDRNGRELGNRWIPTEVVEELKPIARAAGLWNLFLPQSSRAPEGLSNLDYAPLCEIMGRVTWAPEIFNCSAPDTGNMETIERYGSEENKREWLEPLLRGEIRSAFAMTEPDVASSDATNISTRIERDGDSYVINGRKWWISGAGDPRCKIFIVMLLTSPDGPPSRKHSQILVPRDTPGVEIVGPMEVFGEDDAPHGHMHIRFNSVRVPKENILQGEGKGFEISQVRLGPGRIHHCMRSIGAAERALELMIRRGLTREAFGKPIVRLGKNPEVIAKARIEIEACRLMVLRAAKAMDTMGNAEARIWVSAIKAMVPIRVCAIIDEAIQMHGATGVSQWSPLSRMYASQRTLRLADGPDEVHWSVVARSEINRYEGEESPGKPETYRGMFSGPS